MSVTNGERLATKQDLADMYQGILPYLGGMPEIVANKFSKGDLYSTDEKMIGQWIDGKPLYQKVVEFNLGSTTPDTQQTLITGVDKIINYNGYYTDGSSGYYMALPFVSLKSDASGTQYVINVMRNDNNEMYIQKRANISVSYTGFVAIQYTKTTDTAISIGSDTDYSTEEKIVGTWIDGKPIWQKTIEISSVTSKSWNTTAHGISNIDKVVKYEGFLLKSNGAIQSVGANNSERIMGFANRTNVELWLDLDLSSAQGAIVTIQYTKTTD